MRCYHSITEMIGRTPLLKLERPAEGQQIYAKCEFMNPMSLNDRAVLQVIEDAESREELAPGSTLIECTSGNTGMAVAFVAIVKGYKAILVMSELQSAERRQVLRALGAELVLTAASEGTAGARRKLQEICVEHPEYYYLGHHVNPSNPKAHDLNTGPEIWDDAGGRIDVLAAALGTGGTVCGAGKSLKRQKPGARLVAVEPAESPTISQGIWRSHRMMGMAPGFARDPGSRPDRRDSAGQ